MQAEYTTQYHTDEVVHWKEHVDGQACHRVDRTRTDVEPGKRIEQRRRLGGRVSYAAVEELEVAQPALTPAPPCRR